MTQTKEGGLKAAATNKAKYGKDFYRIIGAKGGRNGVGKGGFAANPELARIAGAKGGRRSKSGLTFIKEENGCNIYETKDGEEVRFGVGESMHGSKDIDELEKEIEQEI